MPTDEQHIQHLKDARHLFSASTGLDIIFHKSCMTPINISEQRLHDLAQVFGCKMGKLPFTYLGLPMGTTRTKMADFLPLVDCMERRLTASSTFLTQGGRLQLL